MFWNLIAKGGLNDQIFSIGFEMLKIYLFQMTVNSCEMWSNEI